MNKLSALVFQAGSSHIGTNSFYPQSAALEPTKKLEEACGNLFYELKIDEFYLLDLCPPLSKRASIFSMKAARKQSYVARSSNMELAAAEETRSSTSKLPKRFSIFKAPNNGNNLLGTRSKAKSLANIHKIEDIAAASTADSDSSPPLSCHANLPPEAVFNHVSETQDLGWVRVGDLISQDGSQQQLRDHKRDSTGSYHGPDAERVELWSVQPDNGPVTGNFPVVLEGRHFSLGLFDLTYICIDGLEPIDANECSEILSDTEIMLTMPAAIFPGIVTIRLELLDGYRISCVKKFHYTDSAPLDMSGSDVLTPRYFGGDEPAATHQFGGRPNMLVGPAGSHDNIHMHSNTEDDLDILSPLNGSVQPVNPVKFDFELNDDLAGVGCHDDHKNENGSPTVLPDDSHSETPASPAKKHRKRSNKSTKSKTSLYKEVAVLREEVAELRSQLNEMKTTSESHLLLLQSQLESRNIEVDNISQNLCNLKVRLLEDGLTKYLELH